MELVDRFLFPPWVNKFTLMVLAGVGAGGAYAGALLGFGTWPAVMNTGYAPEQPVPFSHRLHAGELKMDCRYCHNTVDKTAHAAVPSTNVCWNCHTSRVDPNDPGSKTAIHAKSLKLEPVRLSMAKDEPVPWKRVHDLADYVYFNHSIHVNRGISCVECHGRIDKMDVVQQDKSLSMSFCIECHRNPAPRMRPLDQVTNLAWQRPGELDQHITEMEQLYGNGGSVQASTSCSTCHR